MAYYDEDGKEVKAVSAEEAAAQAKAAADAALASEATKAADKERNFAAQRKQAEEKEKTLVAEKEAAVAAAEKKATEATEALTKKDQEILEKGRTAMIDAMAEGKKELKEKIELHIKQRQAEIKTPEDFARVLNDAYVVSAGQVVPDKLTGVISSAGAAPGNDNNVKLPISAEALPVAHKLGVTDEDLKKYGGQVK